MCHFLAVQYFIIIFPATTTGMSNAAIGHGQVAGPSERDMNNKDDSADYAKTAAVHGTAACS